MTRLFAQIYEDDNENDVDAKAEGKHENLFPKKINGHHTFSAYRNFGRLLVRAGKSKSLIRWKRLKGGKRRERRI